MAGNIIKVKEGSYRLRYKDLSKYVKAKSDREAEKLLASFVTEIENGDFEQPSKVTFKEFVQKWLKEYAEVELAPKTVFRYKQMLESRIIPYFGDTKLSKIKPLQLVEFYNSLKQDGGKSFFVPLGKHKDKLKERVKPLSPETIKYHHKLIDSIFARAIVWNIYKGKNPAENIAPKGETHSAVFFNENDVIKMIEALDNEELRYKVAICLDLVTGARIGELMGLEWQDIDFDNKRIIIRQSSQYLPGKGNFTKQPKTTTSVRKVIVNDSTIELLKEYQADQAEKGFICSGNNRLFIKYDGTPMHTYTFSQWFPKFLKENNLPHMNFHGLRHTSATFLISQGMDLQTVASRLGHATSITTQRVYSHFLESKDKKAASLIESAFGKKKRSNKSKKGTS